MADIGYNFRATSGYVGDGAGETYVLDTDTYPTTRGGTTFGWIDSPGGGRDRDLGNDRRLAGINFGNNVRFQIDLPSTGTYAVHLAMGDAGGQQFAMQVRVKDSTATLLTIGPHDTITNEFFDSSDTSRTNLTWPGNEVAASLTFSTTTCILKFETATSNTCVAHLRLVQTAAAAAPSPPMPVRLVAGRRRPLKRRRF